MIVISPSWLEDRAKELTTSIVFSTRLPLLGATPAAAGDIAKAAWAFPIAGILVGLIGAIVYALAHRIGVPPWPAAALAVTATLAATAAMHEAGLAGTIDGLSRGNTREQKLDIMAESHLGVYGACALVLTLVLRVSALAALPSAHAVVWALIAAHGGARAAMMALLFLLPPARSDGLSPDAGRPPADSAAAAAALGILLLVCCLGFGRGMVALIFALILLAGMTWLSSEQIEGQTGEVAGALEQASEIVILLAAVA
jgi:adenosylcobinamide-GDP ribazoletransferase